MSIIDTVKRLLGVKKSGPRIELVVSCEKLEKRVALLEDGQLEEYSIERDSERNIVGGIFKGKVRNIEHGLKAMFVDIGFEKNAFLHFWDAIPAALDSGIEAVQRAGGSAPSKKKITAKDIPNIYPVGSEVMVQVTKGPIGTKGPRITTNISMAGRYMVLMPFNEQCGISRKIEDPKERARLRKILTELTLPEGMGIIIRTAGEGQKARFFVRDLGFLLDQWREVAGCFLGDYYPLTPYSLGDDRWIAWQFDRPEQGDGMIQAFRRKDSIYEAMRTKLHGLDPSSVYTIKNLDLAGTTEMTGRELMERGLPVVIKDQPGAVVIVYQKKP